MEDREEGLKEPRSQGHHKKTYRITEQNHQTENMDVLDLGPLHICNRYGAWCSCGTMQEHGMSVNLLPVLSYLSPNWVALSSLNRRYA